MLRYGIRAAFLSVALLLLLPAAFSAEERGLNVQLASGRHFSGQIDDASTSEKLVLRSAREGITIRRSIAWEHIVAVTVDGQPEDIARLRAAAHVVTTEPLTAAAVKPRSTLLTKIQLRGEWPPAAEKPPAAEPPPRVTQVVFDSFVANWDADVETDGLVIDVAPLDINRNLIATGGTLEVELFAPQRRSLDLVPQSGGDTLELVERWNRSIAAEDFDRSGARLRLPFGAVHPEVDVNWAASSYGLVHARFSIPGQGVFDESRDGVQVRPWATNRDRLEMQSGQRFLPTENLGRRN